MCAGNESTLRCEHEDDRVYIAQQIRPTQLDSLARSADKKRGSAVDNGRATILVLRFEVAAAKLESKISRFDALPALSFLSTT